MSKNNSSALYKIVSEKIKQTGQNRITFADYLDLVLYHPESGYYSSGTVNIGAKGDFFTASSLGKDFGELLAVQLVEMWHKLDCPHSFTIVEMGAGNGNLAADILQFFLTQDAAFIEALEYIIIEKSSTLIEQQQQKLGKYSSLNITWQDWQDIPDDSLVGCFISNELVDAFPVHKVTIEEQQLQEIYVTLGKDKLTEVTGEISTSKVIEYFDLINIDLTQAKYPHNYNTEVNLAALEWLQTLSKKLQQGYIITIDYGYNAERYYHPQRDRGTLQCYYQHRRHNNPYVNLGKQDITSHVNFTALENYGKQQQLETIGFSKQAMFLMALGLGDRLNDLSSGKYNAIEILQKRDALHQLIDPMGLGGFGVLIQGKNLNLEQKILRGLTIPSY